MSCSSLSVSLIACLTPITSSRFKAFSRIHWPFPPWYQSSVTALMGPPKSSIVMDLSQVGVGIIIESSSSGPAVKPASIWVDGWRDFDLTLLKYYAILIHRYLIPRLQVLAMQIGGFFFPTSRFSKLPKNTPGSPLRNDQRLHPHTSKRKYWTYLGQTKCSTNSISTVWGAPSKSWRNYKKRRQALNRSIWVPEARCLLSALSYRRDELESDSLHALCHPLSALSYPSHTESLLKQVCNLLLSLKAGMLWPGDAVSYH